MAFQKGNSGNPGGRPKGAKNKVNDQLREMIGEFLNGQFKTVKAEFKKLSPRDKMKFYCDLLQYGLPKLQATSLDIGFEHMTEEQLDQIIERLKSSQDD